jgi:integrase
MVLSMSRPWKHPKTGVYYFRKVVPEAMRELVGKVEVRQTLGTKTPRDAALRHAEVAAKVASEWEALRRGPEPLTRKQATALSGLWYRWFVPMFEEDPGEDPDGWIMWAEELHDIDMSGRPELDEPDERDIPHLTRSPATQRRIDAFLMDRGRINAFFEARDVHLFPAQLPAFMTALETEFYAAMRLLARRAGRDWRPDKRPEKFPEWQPTAAAKEDPAAALTPTLTGILEGWWREAQATGRKPSTHESYSNTVAGLVAFLGHDDAKLVTPEDVVRFKDHRLSSINPRTGKPISAKTVKDSDLAGLKTLFGWAVSNRKLTSNPATGITIKLGKPQKLRGKGLTEEEAKAILQAALKVTGEGRTDAARRWVPWLAAYTGARVGELAQLRKQDVTKDGEHWTIRLTPEAGTIKTNEARTVVLHPHLVELGFPAFAEAADAGHMFLKPSKLGDVLGPLQGLKNRLAEFSRSIVSDPNVAAMHGFRHRFKTVGMEAGVSTRVLDAIQGHAARTAGDSYGDVTVKAMAQAMEKVPRVEVEGAWTRIVAKVVRHQKATSGSR